MYEDTKQKEMKNKKMKKFLCLMISQLNTLISARIIYIHKVMIQARILKIKQNDKKNNILLKKKKFNQQKTFCKINYANLILLIFKMRMKNGKITK